VNHPRQRRLSRAWTDRTSAGHGSRSPCHGADEVVEVAEGSEEETEAVASAEDGDSLEGSLQEEAVVTARTAGTPRPAADMEVAAEVDTAVAAMEVVAAATAAVDTVAEDTAAVVAAAIAAAGAAMAAAAIKKLPSRIPIISF